MNRKTTIGQDIDHARWLARYPALSVMVLFRHDIGYRLLSPATLIITFCIFTLFAANGNNRAFRPQDLFVFGVAMLLAGLGQRIARRRGITQGVQHHTFYIGTSFLETRRTPDWLRRNRRIPRFLEPFICFVIGLVIFDDSPMLGAWLMFAGFCLLAFEGAVHRRTLHRKLDTADGLIDSAIQGEHAEHFSEPSAPGQNPTAVPGVPTGEGADIAGKIKNQKNKNDPLC